jgi:cell division ATPase FtsA
MPNWIAFTWETNRLMLLTAAVHNGTATFERAAVFAVAPELPPLKQQLADFLQKNHQGKLDAVAVLSRADVEVRPMLFPPVPVDELPDLVKFQAAKEFNNYDGSAPLDFFITNKLNNVSRSTLFPAIKTGKKGKKEAKAGIGDSRSLDAPKHVLASTLRSETLKKIENFCNETGITLKHLVLRPCETATLWKQKTDYDLARSVLFVELDAEETSQVVIFQGEPVFLRSPRIHCPENVSDPDFAVRLIAELKRTQIAVRNEIQGVSVDDVVLCGSGEQYEALAKLVSEGLSLPVKAFDPWNDVAVAGELRKTPVAKTPERFAPLIGAVLQNSKGLSAVIDFCNPKKRKEPVGQRQLFTGILAAVLFFAVGAAAFGVYYRISLNGEVKALSAQLNSMSKTAKTVVEQRTQNNAIDAWQADNINWFEQIDWLSKNVPASQEMMLTELTLTANSGGTMNLRSLLKDSAVVSPVEEKLRDEHHEIKAGDKGEVKGNPQYKFQYNFSILYKK